MQFIGRTHGETKTHIYDNSRGYPIRVCNWAIPTFDFIENGDAPLCKYCQAYREGIRRTCFAPSPEQLSPSPSLEPEQEVIHNG